jgi:cell division protein FtsZ
MTFRPVMDETEYEQQHFEDETTTDDVTIRPLPPRPAFFEDNAQAEDHMEDPAAFIPPEPERRGPRMPRLDELPVPAQNQILQRDGSFAVSDHHPEKKRATLLQRLAQVGLGRKEEVAEERAEPALEAPAAPAEPKRAARERTQGSLDSHGRSKPSRLEDDLEIPAFLRRQAN